MPEWAPDTKRDETRREVIRHLVGLVCALAALMGGDFMRELARQLWGRDE